jgi:hypothetical protein
VNQTATGSDRIAAELAADLDAGFAALFEGVVTAALAASGFAGAACSFLSARRRAAEVPAARGEERVPARAR